MCSARRRNPVRTKLIFLCIILQCLHFCFTAFTSPATLFVDMPEMNAEDVTVLINQADRDMEELFRDVYERGIEIPQGSPAWYMATSHSMNPVAKNLSITALILEEATRYLAEEYKLSREQIMLGLKDTDISRTNVAKQCLTFKDKPCQPRKYRAFSGYCNNVLNPHWGTANSAYSRFLLPDYADGISLPRGGGITDTETLPSPREISLAVHSKSDKEHKHLMTIAAVWGEFISHDLSHTPQMTGHNGKKLKCCGVTIDEFHPECFPIRIPLNDPIFSPKREKCQEFVRSATATRTDCTMGPREQINQATSFLDASQIYGSSRSDSNLLRLFKNGLLRSQESSGSSIMPLMPANNFCRLDIKTKGCFLSGDVRSNEHVGLSVMYTLWLRQHNKIARYLAKLNPHWSDETIFQETRKIVIAAIQHITYREYLPILLGERNIVRHNLNLESATYYHNYDININPTVANSVATAALSSVTSLLPNVLSVFNQRGEKLGEQSLLTSFYAPFTLYEYGGADRVLQGMLHGNARNADNSINDVLLNSMFKDQRYQGGGLDMASQIIQRGRDHGLPAYVEWRNFCKLPPVNTFADLAEFIPENVIRSLQKVYKDVADIDLFTGALSELTEDGALVGPTFACILSEQFKRLRNGDRHWYENNLPPSSFTLDQLNEIRKITLSKIICDNSDFINKVQRNVFIGKDSFLNAMQGCSSTENVNLDKWKEINPEIVLDRHLLEAAMQEARQDLERIMNKEMASLKPLADPRSSIGAAFGFNRPKRQATIIANSSLIYQFASRRFVNDFLRIQHQDQETKNNKYDLERIKNVMSLLPNINIVEVMDLESEKSVCDDLDGPCDHTSKYRTITGRCNNLKYPKNGQALKPFLRILQPSYDDGVASPRQTSVDGDPLPSARLISSNLHPDHTYPHTRYSLMLMQFAQLMDHELTHTPVNKGHMGRGILDCSPCDAAETVHPDCIPIPVPPNDPYFPLSLDGFPKCIPVTRSLPGRLSLGYREQMSQVTAYIDGSFIYGSDNCEAKILRKFFGGLLNATEFPGRKELLPKISTHPECRSKNGICLRAGDERASEQPGLTCLHTVFLREHNRIASQLEELNPHWDDEIIYQETRKILGAIIQHIAFNEFLPRIFGWDNIKKFNLVLEKDDYYKGYDSDCDATILNEFAAAAYRFGHSLLKPKFVRLNHHFERIEPSVRLRDHFFNSELIFQEGIIDEILRGIIVTPMETLDPFITQEVTNHLFEDRKQPFSGLDLAATNVQRARDHGIPSYNNYREYCNLTRAKTFEDLQNTTPIQLIESLKKVYKNVDDIDLFPGGLLETPLPGGVIGPTIACIIGHQFRRLRKCDRFWYENNDPFVRFSTNQLQSIKKASLARILCDNMDRLDFVQKHVMDLPDRFLNPSMDCESIPSVDLTLWKDKKACTIKHVTLKNGAVEKISPCVTCACTKEGPICKSQKIHNCYKLLETFSWTKVMDDPVCKVQCAFLNQNSLHTNKR